MMEPQFDDERAWSEVEDEEDDGEPGEPVRPSPPQAPPALEVDPADLLDQRREVPLDDDERRSG